jgi:hypothetical protein
MNKINPMIKTRFETNFSLKINPFLIKRMIEHRAQKLAQAKVFNKVINISLKPVLYLGFLKCCHRTT